MSPKLWVSGFHEIAGVCSDKKSRFCPLHRQEPGALRRSALELPESLGIWSQKCLLDLTTATLPIIIIVYYYFIVCQTAVTENTI